MKVTTKITPPVEAKLESITLELTPEEAYILARTIGCIDFEKLVRHYEGNCMSGMDTKYITEGSTRVNVINCFTSFFSEIHKELTKN